MKQHFDPKTVNYDLPEDRIALYPLPERDQSKLLIMPKGEDSIECAFPRNFQVDSR